MPARTIGGPVLARAARAATLNIANGILLESYISFVGHGSQPPVASWGNMLNNAQSYFDTAAWRSSRAHDHAVRHRLQLRG
jgi:ABC-type dipeptide/oligopeptide/nickel transport system permease subunit